jgi:hypothetical protein
MSEQRNDGIKPEKKVESWARKTFKASSTETRYYVNGLSIKRPYEVDVWVHIDSKFLGLLGSERDIWIECKDRKASIKSKDISNLVSKAKDVYQAANSGKQPFYFDRLMFVSTSRYDSDAIAFADQEGVTCVLYNGKSYLLANKWNWEEDPKWLSEVQAV